MKYYLICLLACLLAISSCGRGLIEVWPEAVMTDSKEQDIVFRTNYTYNSVGVVTPHTTGSSEISESVDTGNGTVINSCNWFRLESKYGSSTEIKLHLEENTNNTDRQLEFMVYYYGANATVLVTQSGTRP